MNDRHSALRFLLFVFFFGMLCGWSKAGTFYVSKAHGDDTADGSQDHPFKTIARAVKEVDGPGGEIDLDPSGGCYQEIIYLAKGGTATNPLIIDGHGAVINLGADVTSGPWTDTGAGFRLERPVIKNERAWLATVAFVNGLPIFTHPQPGHENGRPMAWHGGYASYDDQGRLILVFPQGLNPGNSVVVLTGGAACCGGAKGPHFMACGVQLAGASYVQVRNLVSAFSPNDGFNFHGRGHDILIDNVKGIFNGDQGTSAHFDAHETYQINFQNSEFAFDGSGSAAVEDGQGTMTNYKNVRVHQNRDLGFRFSAFPPAPNQPAIDTGGHHVLDHVVSFENGTLNLPKASPYVELIDCQDLGQIGADKEIPVVADPTAPLDPSKPVEETDRLGRFLQVRPPHS